MGDFRIVINAVGGHGQDRTKKDGEIVDFTNTGGGFSKATPEAIAEEFIQRLRESGVSITSAKVIHWPADNYPEATDRKAGEEVVDDLVTKIRKNSF